ncbi:selenite/tellurite reduction operon rhodanese-like protein ExtH [Desulfuromonas sp. AOP6]|uniref:selenite/tellurite reduction operon rhodanese-like protein ExtH n=1 Tax=Desulfuromonas sp. AOP6 TaxID=1566351 RepID=UPI00127748B5|nr:selenite/tellurite reduction operon rhodanese-like protein ExtH [Desulfuromonas sp. AOP6]BCA78877.1 hypothetical protein AOP6_0664 [Desulfuromonas sp. AOP6]
MNLSTFRKSFMMVTLALLTSVVMWGCGSDSYTDHTAQVQTRTETPVITAEQLKSWFDAGLVNADGNENVVILHLDATTEDLPDNPGTYIFTGSTIPNAYLWDTRVELSMTRLEGLGNAGSSVITGPMMDAILQRAGANKYSTIVITGPAFSLNSGGTPIVNWAPARAYFTLRYWGIPKERIKFLNGGVSAWSAAYVANPDWDTTTFANWDLDANGLTTKRPIEYTNNTFSVRENYQLRDDLRYSIGEMIQVVEDNTDGSQEFNIIHRTSAASSPTLLSAIVRDTTELFTPDWAYKTADAILTDVVFDTDAILDPTKESGVGDFVEGLPTITHCASGMSCAPIFFSLDAILGWNVAIFDGSTNQWNAYRGLPAEDRVIPNDAWNTSDLSTNPAALAVDSKGNTYDIIDPILNSRYMTVDDPRANQIENEDSEYMSTLPSAPTNVGTGDASGC